MEKKYNLRSPSVKRLMKEAKELFQPTELYYAQPLEDNLFEWHFTIRGPPDSDFAGGRYHGRITLPPEYPMKPPSIMISTPNGRFEIGKKICLSMSAHHPETWQPSWSIRTVLMALIGFMPTQGAGAIGALDYTPQERKALAKKSRDWDCNTCGVCAASALKESTDYSSTAKEAEREAAELASQIVFKGESEKEKKENDSVVNSSEPAAEVAAPPAGAGPSVTIPHYHAQQADAASTTPLHPTMGGADQIPQTALGYQTWPYSFYPYGNPLYMPQGLNQPDNMPQATGINPGVQTSASTGNTNSPPLLTQATSTVGSNFSDVTNNDSSVRQRTIHQQQGLTQAPSGAQQVPAQGSGQVAQPQVMAQPHISQRGMASLLVIWILLAAITALVVRRIFILS